MQEGENEEWARVNVLGAEKLERIPSNPQVPPDAQVHRIAGARSPLSTESEWAECPVSAAVDEGVGSPTSTRLLNTATMGRGRISRTIAIHGLRRLGMQTFVSSSPDKLG